VKDLVENKLPMEQSRVPAAVDVSDELLSMWLVIPPFPPRPASLPRVDFPVKILPKDMTHEEAEVKMKELFKLFDAFDEYVGLLSSPPTVLTGQLRQPPFTIQRLAELALRPREHYNLVGKYLRAIERSLVVTSGWDEFPVDTYTEDASSLNGAFSVSNQALAHATTPLFSPIPFLVNRERSQSPTSTVAPSPLTLDGRKPLPGDDAAEQSDSSAGSALTDENTPPSSGGGMSPAMIRSLRVDELDHISPPSSPTLGGSVPIDESRLHVPALAEDGLPLSPSKRFAHLADHPESFSATTTVPGPNTRSSALGLGLSSGRSGATSTPPISERFIRESTPEPSPTRASEEVKRQAAELAKTVTSMTRAGVGKSPSDADVEAEEGEVEDVIMKDS
jgi:hypothetical protein